MPVQKKPILGRSDSKRALYTSLWVAIIVLFSQLIKESVQYLLSIVFDYFHFHEPTGWLLTGAGYMVAFFFLFYFVLRIETEEE